MTKFVYDPVSHDYIQCTSDDVLDSVPVDNIVVDPIADDFDRVKSLQNRVGELETTLSEMKVMIIELNTIVGELVHDMSEIMHELSE